MRAVAAVLVCDSTTGNLEVAGVTVLDRLVVTAHRAGCDPIFLVCNVAPRLTRAVALGIRTSCVSEIPPLEAPALLVAGSVLVEARDLKNLMARGGQLSAADGAPLPIRVTAGSEATVVAGPVATSIVDPASALEAERKLWASLTSTADGIVDRFFNRPLGRPLSKLLVHTPVSPNQVSVVSILIGLASAWFFAAGHFISGALVLQLCAIVDCVDGDLARALFKQSRLGQWLDLAGDQVVHFSVFAAIGIGVARTSPTVPAFALGASAALGVLLSFAVIVRALRQAAAERGPF